MPVSAPATRNGHKIMPEPAISGYPVPAGTPVYPARARFLGEGRGTAAACGLEEGMAACALGGRRGSIADREEGGGARMEERTGGGGGARIPQGGGGGGTTHTPAGRRGLGGAAAGGGLAEQRPDRKHRPEGPWPLGEGTPSRRSEGERLEGEAAETPSSPGIAAAGGGALGGGGRQGLRRPEREPARGAAPGVRCLAGNGTGLGPLGLGVGVGVWRLGVWELGWEWMETRNPEALLYGDVIGPTCQRICGFAGSDIKF
ncbi:circumsporozoite protein-like [Panicum virgatum]|uniref:circumsporozoite protein-like n=1 Tax=Panicum virgatum TaxID=38727 RepID=UPI0019D6582F|nr:circumsporozoite protein-like [Panicum virgatum]